VERQREGWWPNGQGTEPALSSRPLAVVGKLSTEVGWAYLDWRTEGSLAAIGRLMQADVACRLLEQLMLGQPAVNIAI